MRVPHALLPASLAVAVCLLGASCGPSDVGEGEGEGEGEPLPVALERGGVANVAERGAAWAVALALPHAEEQWRADASVFVIEARSELRNGLLPPDATGLFDGWQISFNSESAPNEVRQVVVLADGGLRDEGTAPRSTGIYSAADNSLRDWRLDSPKAAQEVGPTEQPPRFFWVRTARAASDIATNVSADIAADLDEASLTDDHPVVGVQLEDDEGTTPLWLLDGRSGDVIHAP
jgi:hypothetical protein